MAKAYFPESSEKNARRRFFNVLKAERDLWERLRQLHFHNYQRNFTPRQYEAVIDTLGIPEWQDTGYGEWPE